MAEEELEELEELGDGYVRSKTTGAVWKDDSEGWGAAAAEGQSGQLRRRTEAEKYGLPADAFTEKGRNRSFEEAIRIAGADEELESKMRDKKVPAQVKAEKIAEGKSSEGGLEEADSRSLESLMAQATEGGESADELISDLSQGEFDVSKKGLLSRAVAKTKGKADARTEADKAYGKDLRTAIMLDNIFNGLGRGGRTALNIMLARAGLPMQGDYEKSNIAGDLQRKRDADLFAERRDPDAPAAQKWKDVLAPMAKPLGIDIDNMTVEDLGRLTSLIQGRANQEQLRALNQAKLAASKESDKYKQEWEKDKLDLQHEYRLKEQEARDAAAYERALLKKKKGGGVGGSAPAGEPSPDEWDRYNALMTRVRETGDTELTAQDKQFLVEFNNRWAPTAGRKTGPLELDKSLTALAGKHKPDDKIVKSLQAADKTMEQIRALSEQLRENPEVSTGPLARMLFDLRTKTPVVTEMLTSMGMAPKEAEVAIMTRLSTMLNELIKDLSGATVPAQEVPRLERQMVNPGDTRETIMAKMKIVSEIAERTAAEAKSLAASRGTRIPERVPGEGRGGTVRLKHPKTGAIKEVPASEAQKIKAALAYGYTEVK